MIRGEDVDSLSIKLPKFTISSISLLARFEKMQGNAPRLCGQSSWMMDDGCRNEQHHLHSYTTFPSDNAMLLKHLHN